MKKSHWPNWCGKPFSPLAIAGMVIAGLALAVAFAFLFGLIVMILWNWIMPDIFGLPRISYWQAWGLVLLSHILIKAGFRSGPGGHDHGGNHGRHKDCADGRPTEGEWCDDCDDCDWQNECAKHARGWRRTADGWKCDTADVKKDLADRVDGDRPGSGQKEE